VKTVVLLNEEHTTALESGRFSTTTRTAMKILARQGVDVVFSDEYDTRGGKVRDFRAWMISPSGKVKKYGKDEILDVACAPNYVYDECRRRVVSANATPRRARFSATNPSSNTRSFPTRWSSIPGLLAGAPGPISGHRPGRVGS